jgi:hypothetical protein
MIRKGSIARAIVCVAASALLAGCGSVTRSAIKGDVDGIREHLKKGENVNVYDRWGWTPLIWTAYYNNYEAAECLLQNGADPNARTRKAYGAILTESTPIMVAAYYGQAGMVRLLMRYRADKNARNSAGQTAMNIAEKFNFEEILSILEKGTSYREPERRETPEERAAVQTIFLTDGSTIVGTIIAQTRETVTVKTKYTTMTIQKNQIREMKYK